MLKTTTISLVLSIALAFSTGVNATIVQFQTVLGTFEVNLYDEDTPATVANFLNYVNDRDYDNVVIHRSAPGFVVQGGGLVSTGSLPLISVPTDAAVVNEPEFSNVRGTIAMAKLDGDPNSATSQWFFNMADNSANLDVQNGGFTVFGEVTGMGMDVIDAIEALPLYDLGGALGSLPLRAYSQQDANNGVPITDQHLVLITAVVVIDGAADTASSLSPTPNTLLNPPPAAPPASDGGGGGAMGLGILFVLVTGRLFARRRSRIR